ncbi:MAG: hypothetical protein ACOX50_03875 [Patescibacteria group bacterium]|jgi:hypothetical protein
MLRREMGAENRSKMCPTESVVDYLVKRGEYINSNGETVTIKTPEDARDILKRERSKKTTGVSSSSSTLVS